MLCPCPCVRPGVRSGACFHGDSSFFDGLWRSIKSSILNGIRGFRTCVRSLTSTVFRDFCSDILGVKIVEKKVDTLGNLEFFVVGVGCWGWVVEGGKCIRYASIL